MFSMALSYRTLDIGCNYFSRADAFVFLRSGVKKRANV
jgi:hypothetical protein